MSNREVMQQALEALEFDRFTPEDETHRYYTKKAITALRTALEQQQQAEPVCPECKAAVLYECVACSSNNYPPQQQAEPVAWVFTPNNDLLWPHEVEVTNPIELNSYQPLYTAPPQQQAKMRLPKVGDKVICLEDESLGEVVSLTAGGSPDIVFDDGSRGTYLLREFAELFSYATPPQRQWVGLEAEDLAQIESDEFWQVGNHMAIAMAVEAKLKERNNV